MTEKRAERHLGDLGPVSILSPLGLAIEDRMLCYWHCELEATYTVFSPVIIGIMGRKLVGFVACHDSITRIRSRDLALGETICVYSHGIGHG